MGVEDTRPIAIRNTTKHKAMKAHILSRGSDAFMALLFTGLAITYFGASCPRIFLHFG